MPFVVDYLLPAQIGLKGFAFDNLNVYWKSITIVCTLPVLSLPVGANYFFQTNLKSIFLFAIQMLICFQDLDNRYAEFIEHPANRYSRLMLCACTPLSRYPLSHCLRGIQKYRYPSHYT